MTGINSEKSCKIVSKLRMRLDKRTPNVGLSDTKRTGQIIIKGFAQLTKKIRKTSASDVGLWLPTLSKEERFKMLIVMFL